MSERNYYKALQVDPEADLDVIRAAHRVLASRLHPERDLTGVDEIRMGELDRALATLSDPFRRKAYDQQHELDMLPVGPGPSTDGDDHPGPGQRADELPRLAHGALTERLQVGHAGANLANVTLDFGRYAGWTLGELARQDPDYLRWLSRHSSGIRYRAGILRLLAETDGTRVPLHVQR